MAHSIFKHSSASTSTVSNAISRGNLGHHINLQLEDGERHHFSECSFIYENKRLVILIISLIYTPWHCVQGYPPCTPCLYLRPVCVLDMVT